MTDDQVKAMRFERPAHIPLAASCLPATWMKYRERLAEIADRHPLVFGKGTGRDFDAIWSETYQAGDHVDEWGCVWSNVCTGMEAIVTGHPLPDRESVRKLTPPRAVTAGFRHGFMYLRLGDLRGFEEIMVDFAEEPPELQLLIDVVLGHNVAKLEKLLAQKTPPDMLYFGDDLGMQHSLPISPAKWRQYLKPCFSRLYGRCHEAGFDVYMHTDGCIHEIIPDLIECGVSVLNPQIRANGLDNLVRACKGKVCVNLDLDRQMFPFASPAQLEAHVRECVEALGSPEGGLWLTAEFAPDVPLENIEAVATAMETYRDMWSR